VIVLLPSSRLSAAAPLCRRVPTVELDAVATAMPPAPICSVPVPCRLWNDIVPLLTLIVPVLLICATAVVPRPFRS